MGLPRDIITVASAKDLSTVKIHDLVIWELKNDAIAFVSQCPIAFMKFANAIANENAMNLDQMYFEEPSTERQLSAQVFVSMLCMEWEGPPHNAKLRINPKLLELFLKNSDPLSGIFITLYFAVNGMATMIIDGPGLFEAIMVHYLAASLSSNSNKLSEAASAIFNDKVPKLNRVFGKCLKTLRLPKLTGSVKNIK